ncbi:MAG: hypothetical protein ACYS99_19740, partial [Planctomycetota bacterium]
SATGHYYVPDGVRARVNVDQEVMNGYDATLNPWPYALADQYNHAMRLPEEEALFAQRVASGVDAEPSWRLLLERMASNPDANKNAILVNLHGELLPLPPLRNYSDAARAPLTSPGVRVVTHPERLWYQSQLTIPPPTPAERIGDVKHDLEDLIAGGIDPALQLELEGVIAFLSDALLLLGQDPPDVPAAVTKLESAKTALAGATDAMGDFAPGQQAALVTTLQEIIDELQGGPAPPSTTISGEDIRLRVYTYKTDPASGPELMSAPVILEIPGLDLAGNVNGSKGGDPTLFVHRISGGLDLDPVDGSRDVYVAPGDPGGLAPFVESNKNYSPAFAGEMYFRVYERSDPLCTVIELHNSPLVSPPVGNQGLGNLLRLYGLEYVPCSVEAANDFSVDLATNDPGAKNTARWIITIPATELGMDRRVEVITRIGWDDGGDIDKDGAAFSTGIMYPPADRNQPENVSRTYTWWTEGPLAVPFTERYQFQGDPRHCPYADLKSGGISFPNGYNWFFDDFESADGNALAMWPGFDAGRLKNDGTLDNDGWNGRCEIDVPRLLQLLRVGLVSSESLYTTLTGWSYYYIGVGGEIGYDANNGFPNSIPVSGLPFGQPGDGFEMSINSSGGSFGSGVKYVRANDALDYWWGVPWLGELYPDSAYAAWRVPRYEYSDTLPLPAPLPAPAGNLPAGSAVGEFRRVPRDQIATFLPFGTVFTPTERRTRSEACTSFFNIGTASSSFHHRSESGTSGNLTVAGRELARDFRFPLPSTTLISRPFVLASDHDGGLGDEFARADDFPRHSASMRTVYFDHSTGATGSAIVELTAPDGSRSAYVLVSGLDSTTESGSAFIARYCSLALIHGFLSSGDPALPRPIPMRPRLVITGPTSATELVDPATIDVSWCTEWLRWDGSPYTSSYPNGFAAAETELRYALLYSVDEGLSWKHMLDDSDATPGVPPPAELLLEDLNAGADEMYSWATPQASFPRGTYVLRIEAYRVGSRLHYSYHQERVFISR